MKKENKSISSTKDPFVYYGEAFAEFLEIYKSEYDISAEFDPWERSNQNVVVKVRGHLMSQNLAPFLEALFARYGDFSTESTLSPRARAFIFDTLCSIVCGMCSITDADITRGLLISWFCCLRIIWLAGFKIQFVFGLFRKVFCCYFGLVYTDPATDNLDTDIAKLRQEVEIYGSECTSKHRISSLVASIMGECSGRTLELQNVHMAHNSWNHYLAEIEEEMVTGFEGDEIFHKRQVSHSEAIQRPAMDYMSLWDYHFLVRKIKTFFEKQPTTTYDEMKNGEDRCYRCELSTLDSPFYKCTGCGTIFQSSTEKQFPCIGGGHNLIPFPEPPSALDVINQDMKFFYVVPTVCFLCNLPIWGPIYHCEKHNTSFHQSCVQFPLEIQHPLHPVHPLVFTRNCGYLKCYACGETFCGPAFSCQICEFYLEVQCIFRETVKSISHEHLLTLNERYSKSRERHCSYCNIFTIPGGPFLYCGLCDFSFHLRCTLSPVITCSCHRHPLTLAEWLEEDDSDEFYCDACEELRKPKDPVYHCGECNNYDAHIGCAIAKIVEE